MNDTEKKAFVIHCCRNSVERGVVAKKKFQEDFEKDPVNALEWADAMFKVGNRAKIHGFVLKALESEKGMGSWDQFVSYVTDQVMNRAMYGSSSTSQCTNLNRQCELMAWSEVLEWVR